MTKKISFEVDTDICPFLLDDGRGDGAQCQLGLDGYGEVTDWARENYGVDNTMNVDSYRHYPNCDKCKIQRVSVEFDIEE